MKGRLRSRRPHLDSRLIDDTSARLLENGDLARIVILCATLAGMCSLHRVGLEHHDPVGLLGGASGVLGTDLDLLTDQVDRLGNHERGALLPGKHLLGQNRAVAELDLELGRCLTGVGHIDPVARPKGFDVGADVDLSRGMLCKETGEEEGEE